MSVRMTAVVYMALDRFRGVKSTRKRHHHHHHRNESDYHNFRTEADHQTLLEHGINVKGTRKYW